MSINCVELKLTREPIVELGKSLNKLLTGLEDLGLEAAIPQDMEMDLRHAMDLMEIGEAASSYSACSEIANVSNPWPLINALSPAVKRKTLINPKEKDDIDEGNEADDDLTEEFISKNSPYRNLLDDPYDKQAAQILKDGAHLFLKNGTKNTLLTNRDEDDDTDADIEDVLGEEEISSFVDFLQFAAGNEMGNDDEGSNNSKNEFLQFAAFATAASNVIAKSSSSVAMDTRSQYDSMQKNLVKDEAYAMLPDRLTLQSPDLEDENNLQDEEVSDLEKIFLSSSNFCQRKLDRSFLDRRFIQSTHISTCSKQ